MKLKKHDYILIIICVIVVVITFLIVGSGNSNNNENKLNQRNNYILLNDYSRFFTLESCVYKYIVYLQSRDSDSLLKLLNPEYVKKNSITQDNIFDFLGYLDGMFTFKAKEIYYEKISNNVIKYYIYGQVIQEMIDTFSSVGTDKYFVVQLDTKNMTYTIEPSDSTLFSEVSNG